MWDYFSKGKGVLLGAYTFGDSLPFVAAAKSPEDRIKDALEYGSKIHPQYKKEFEYGVAVAWHRVPWTLGCAGNGPKRAAPALQQSLRHGRPHRAGGRTCLAPAGLAGRRGAVALDAITRLHQRAIAA